VKKVKTQYYYVIDMEDINFCPACGKNVTSGVAYCPACGTRLNDPEVERRETAAVNTQGEKRVTLAVAVLLVCAALSVVSGLWIYFSADSMAQLIHEMMGEEMIFDTAYLVSLMEWSGIMTIFAGGVAAVASLLAYKRRMWAVTLIICIVVIFFGSIICLIAAWLIYKAKPVFKD
jgi:hypothetical protein